MRGFCWTDWEDDGIIIFIQKNDTGYKDENLLRGVLIGVGVVSFLVYGGYWIYIIVHETRIRKGFSYGSDEQNTLKKKRLAILKAHKIQAKARGEKLSKEEIEDISSGKYDNEVSNG